MAKEVKFVTLPHENRRIAYMELGCTDGTARRSLLALHGLMSCRLCAMPGISEEVLKEFGVRFVAIDRPGYGQSDPDSSQTFYSSVKDIEAVIDALELGKKVYLMGLSMGGAFCWAAARYIPERIAGIAMWSPVGSFGWKGISLADRAAMQASFTTTERVLSSVARLLPFVAFRWFAKHLSAKMEMGAGSTAAKGGLSAEDWECLQRPGVGEQMASDYKEAIRHHEGFGVAKDLELMIKDWGFEVEDIGLALEDKARVHIWQGDRDRLVPLCMQQWLKKQLPSIVVLHELIGHGHISWSCFNDIAHRATLSALFQDQPQHGE